MGKLRYLMYFPKREIKYIWKYESDVWVVLDFEGFKRFLDENLEFLAPYPEWIGYSGTH